MWMLGSPPGEGRVSPQRGLGGETTVLSWEDRVAVLIREGGGEKYSKSWSVSLPALNGGTMLRVPRSDPKATAEPRNKPDALGDALTAAQ